MALDASIYGQLDTQAPLRLSQMIREANNPMAQAQQMLSLKQMLQQGKLQELQMQQAQAEMAQKAEDRAATRAALADFVAANPDMAQAARMSPQDAVKYFFDQMKAKNAPPDYLVAGDSVLQKPRTAGEQLTPAYTVPGKQQLVEVADPKDPLRTIKQWMRPGETTGTIAGYGTLPEILDPRVEAARERVAAAGKSSTTVNNFPNPIPVTDAQGNTKMVQFGNKGEIRETPYKPPVTDKPLPEGAQKQVVGARNLQSAVTNYLDKLQGWSNMKMLTPDARLEMGNAYNNMMLQAKEAYNLGVLNGPDYMILQKVVQDPTNAISVLSSNEALGRQAKELARIAGGIESTVLQAHGKPVQGAASTSGTVRKYNPITGRIE